MEERRGIARYTKHYKTQDVVAKLHKQRIYDLISSQTEAASGTSEWLKLYPRALAETTKELSKDELADVEETKDEWNARGPSKDEQEKYDNNFIYTYLSLIPLRNKKHLGMTIQKFIKDIERSMDVQLLVFAGHKKSNGNISRQKYVAIFSHHLPRQVKLLSRYQSRPRVGDHAFTEAQADWENDAWSCWGKYLQDQYGKNFKSLRAFMLIICDTPGDEEDSADESDEEDSLTEKNNNKRKEKALELHEDGWPLLPQHINQSLSGRKDIIRLYVTTIYSLSTYLFVR